MPRKALRVQIELDIQAVTCPGVWLCPNGKVSLQIYMLDSCIQTTALPPVFPLLFHEQFIFYKTFYAAHTLMDLQRFIDKDCIYAELIQWQKGEVGNVIASFQTSLQEVLYPSTMEGTLSGVDVDLLMEPSKIFPGIIAPKIEISTRTTVEEVLCSNEKHKPNHYVVNPKTIPSDYIPVDFKRKSKLPRQKKVCHSSDYHRSQRCVPTSKSADARPPFVFKKPENELISRKCQGLDDSRNCCKCRSAETSPTKALHIKRQELIPKFPPKKSIRKVQKCPSSDYLVPYPSQEQKCTCDSNHSGNNCNVCAQYSNYFNPYGEEIEIRSHSPRNAYVRKANSDPAKTVLDNVQDTTPRNALPHKSSPKLRAYSPKSTNSNETREQECNSAPKAYCNNKFCVRCSLTKQPSLAKQIHTRLMQTLDVSLPVSIDSELERRISSGSITACYSPKFRNCDQGFYKTLGKFYKELYRC